MSVTASAGKPSQIQPEILYSLPGFIEASGLSYSRIRKAAKDYAVELPSIKVGRRAFVLGSMGIEYIQKLAHETTKEKNP